jgi:hypothetical protein
MSSSCNQFFVGAVKTVALLLQIVGALVLIIVIFLQLSASSLGNYPWWAGLVPLVNIVVGTIARRWASRELSKQRDALKLKQQPEEA